MQNTTPIVLWPFRRHNLHHQLFKDNYDSKTLSMRLFDDQRIH